MSLARPNDRFVWNWDVILYLLGLEQHADAAMLVLCLAGIIATLVAYRFGLWDKDKR